MARRIALIVLLVLVAMLFLCGLLLTWAIGTNSGTRTLWQTATGALPGLSAAEIEGKLSGPLTLRGLVYETDTMRLQIGGLDLQWSPGLLFKRAIKVDSLQLKNVRYTQLKPSPPEEDKEPFRLPESLDLPVSIELQNIALQSLQYRSTPDAKPFVVDAAALSATLSDNQLEVSRLTAEGPLFDVRGAASAATRDDYNADIKLDWQLRLPDYAAIDGETIIAGGLERLQLEQQIASPYNVTLTARIDEVLGELDLDATLTTRASKLQAISTTLPPATLTSELRVAGAPSQLSYTLQVDALAPVVGEVELVSRGNLAQQLFTLEQLRLTIIDTPTQVTASGEVDLANGSPIVQLDGDWQQLRWPLAGDPQVISPSGKLKVEGSLEDIVASVVAKVQEQGELDVQLTRRGDEINAALDWQQLSWPATAPTLLSPQGEATVKGTLQDYAIELGAALDVPGQTGGQLSLAGRGSDKSFELARLRLDLLDGYLEGDAQVAWQPALSGRIDLSGRNLNPAVLATAWPGQLQVELHAGGETRDGELFADIDTLRVSGSLREQAVDLALNGELRGAQLALETLALNMGESSITAAGSVGESMALTWKIDSPDLGNFVPEASGLLRGSGSVKGRLPWPIVEAELVGDKLGYAQYQVARLDFNADIDVERETPSSVKLTVNGGELGGVSLSDLSLTGNGDRAAHEFILRANTSVGTAALDLAGSLKDKLWSVALTDGRLQYGELAPWTLKGRQPGSVTDKRQQLERGCWVSGEAQLCLEGQRDAEQLAAALDLQQLPFDYFTPLLPASVLLNGQLGARAKLSQQTGKEPSLKLDLDTSAAQLRSPETTEHTGDVLLGLEPGTINLDYSAEGLATRVDLPFVDQGGIFFTANVPGGSAPLQQRPLQGSLKLTLNDISFVDALSPQIDKLSGAITGELALDGTLAEPVPKGELVLRDGAVSLAAPGLDITDLALQVRNSSAAELSFSGQAVSGKGRLELAGSAELAGAQTLANLTVTGEEFQVFNTEDARVYVSPDLAIAVDEGGINITGEVVVPRARITPKELPTSAVGVSDDQVIILQDADTEGSGEAAAARELRAVVKIVLGDKVSVDGFGFKGRVEGELTVEQQPGKPTIGTGELNIVDGEYRAYGQGLVVEKGVILFGGGPIAQPGINVRAVRRPADDITVGVRARGRLQQPDFTLFSEPAMSQSEQLSWLVLGRSLDNASGEESSVVSQAAMALGLKGGNFLTEKLGGNLGVDDIGIETGSGEAGSGSDVNQAAFVIGKYLSPKLYVSYGIGLFNSVSTVNLKYTINDNWKLSTDSSTLSSGGDVIYTIER